MVPGLVSVCSPTHWLNRTQWGPEEVTQGRLILVPGALCSASGRCDEEVEGARSSFASMSLTDKIVCGHHSN